jgi:hypothetical protein
MSRILLTTLLVITIAISAASCGGGSNLVSLNEGDLRVINATGQSIDIWVDDVYKGSIGPLDSRTWPISDGNHVVGWAPAGAPAPAGTRAVTIYGNTFELTLY